MEEYTNKLIKYLNSSIINQISSKKSTFQHEFYMKMTSFESGLKEVNLIVDSIVNNCLVIDNFHFVNRKIIESVGVEDRSNEDKGCVEE